MPIASNLLEPGLAVVSLSGRLVFGREVEQLESTVNDLSKNGIARFVFDLSGLEYLDSSGIGTLVACLTNIKKAGGDLRLASASPRVLRLFSMTGVDKLLTVFPSVAEAAAG